MKYRYVKQIYKIHILIIITFTLNINYRYLSIYKQNTHHSKKENIFQISSYTYKITQKRKSIIFDINKTSIQITKLIYIILNKTRNISTNKNSDITHYHPPYNHYKLLGKYTLVVIHDIFFSYRIKTSITEKKSDILFHSKKHSNGKKITKEKILLIIVTFISILFCSALLLRIRKKNKVIKKLENEISLSKKEDINHKVKEAELRNTVFQMSNISKRIKELCVSEVGFKNAIEKIKELSNNPLSDRDWEELKISIDKSFDNFTIRLKYQYPNLNENDIRFCCLLKINVDAGDIAYILNIDPASVRSKKFRLKKIKLGLDKDTDISIFIKYF